MRVKEKEGFFQDKEFIILAIIVILIENCFYLSFYMDNLKKRLNANDLTLILYIIFGIYVLIKYKGVRMPKHRFTLIFLFTIVLAIISAIIPERLFGQSFFWGFRQQRYFIMYYLMYIPFSKFLYAKKENLEKVKTLLTNIGAVEITFFNIQYLLKGSIMLISVSSSFRYGGVRLHIESYLLTIFYFICLGELLRGKKVKKNLYLVSMVLYYNFFVIRARLAIIGLIVTSIVLFLMWKRNAFLKISSIAFGIVIMISISNLPLFNSYLSVLDTSTRANDPTKIARDRGKAHYKKNIAKSPLLGRGVVSELNKRACEEAGVYKGYFLNDNGLTGFTYMYGYLGVSWIFVFFTVYYFYAIRAYFKKDEYLFLGHIMYLTIIMSNIMEFYWPYGAFFMGISVSMLDVANQGTFDEHVKHIKNKSDINVKLLKTNKKDEC